MLTPAPWMPALDIVPRVAELTRKKEQGNTFYRDGKLSMATRCYKNGVERFGADPEELTAALALEIAVSA